ncbi:PH domain-like protein [Thozetella sp. PMI_491]|nr:PH domain-like protein [Thozetella sp. PMI_491]
MEPSDASSQYDVGDGAMVGRARRMSMEEDNYYRELMTSRPAKPPSYESALKAALAAQRREERLAKESATGFPRLPLEERLPQYSCDVHMEGVFMRKLEIEETIKRAEYRNWQMMYVELHGTALNVYNVKKERAWFSAKTDGPNVSPDNPPWVKKGSLERSYSLIHADAGIAADYKKRRYVIRIRAETDQFLLSCVELPTFVEWLDALFAAISVAAPIDERDFPRDQSIPRIQRIRWLRGQRPRLEDNSTGFPMISERRQEDGFGDDDDTEEGVVDADGEGVEMPEDGSNGVTPPFQHPVVGRLSTTSYPNENIDPDTGKWAPRHLWTSTHDHLYAKLCYAVLLFKSPRKSNYIIAKGKQWAVDWSTGRMARVLPPSYGEVELYGPWQTIHTENRFI